MPKPLLALDTATDPCSVALLEDGAVVVALTLNRPRSHAAQLVPLIQDALRYADVQPADLAGIAVSMGPGSYTGLRIGVSTAKGLALATQATLLGVPTLDAYACAAAPHTPPNATIAVALKSRRHEVYLGSYTLDAARQPVALQPTAAVALSDADAMLPTEAGLLVLVGNGAQALQRALNPAQQSNLHPLTADTLPPLAAAVGHLGHRRLLLGEADAVSTFEPYYLKAFVARPPATSIFERLPF